MLGKMMVLIRKPWGDPCSTEWVLRGGAGWGGWTGKFKAFWGSFLKKLYFVLGHSWLTTLWKFQVYSKGTQPYICMYPFSPGFLPSGLPCSTEQSPPGFTVSPRWLLTFSTAVCGMSIPNSLTGPFPPPSTTISSFSVSLCFVSPFVSFLFRVHI